MMNCTLFNNVNLLIKAELIIEIISGGMNACGLALSQITYLIASLTKKNNKSSIVELNQVNLTSGMIFLTINLAIRY